LLGLDEWIKGDGLVLGDQHALVLTSCSFRKEFTSSRPLSKVWNALAAAQEASGTTLNLTDSETGQTAVCV
jgi:hypothetical protein